MSQRTPFRVALSGLAVLAGASASLGQMSNRTNNILITGYWPPTNEMVRRFSESTTQNPSGWTGRNWEGRGYNVYSFFPEFPGRTNPNWGVGAGDLTVDYQDTWADFSRIVADVKPVAIITFSRGGTALAWEIEPAAQRFRITTGETIIAGRTAATVPVYTSDANGAQLRPDAPEFLLEPAGTVREANLPTQAIISAVSAAIPSSQISPYRDNYDAANRNNGYTYGGGYLSGYIAYLGIWYRDRNNTPAAAFRCVASGHIHVGADLFFNIPVAVQATEITLRTYTTYVDTLIGRCPGDWDNDGMPVGSSDLTAYISDWFEDLATGARRADIDASGVTGSGDLTSFVSTWFAALGGGCP